MKSWSGQDLEKGAHEWFNMAHHDHSEGVSVKGWYVSGIWEM